MKKLISLFIATIFSSLLAIAVQGQDISTTYGVYGYPLGVSELEHTDSLTASQLESIKKVKSRLDKLADGFTIICEEFSIDAVAYSDYHPFKGVSAAQSDLLNDKLAWDRLRKALRYLIDVRGVPEDCFNIKQPVYADSDVRGVRFSLKQKKLPIADAVNESVIAEINEKIISLEDRMQNLRENMEEKNQEQDKQIAANSNRITENSDLINDVEVRLSRLESQARRDISVYAAATSITFAGQTVPAFEAGTKHGSVRLSGWFGYWQDFTANLKEGPRDFDRMLAGASVTWYLLDTNIIDIGPSVGAQWTHDVIDPGKDGVDCRIIYYSTLIGADLTATIGSVDLFGNVSWSPSKEIVRGDIDRTTNDTHIKAGIRIRFN